MPNDTIPEWAADMATVLVIGFPTRNTLETNPIVRATIARALVEAERRGLERAAQHMDQRAREILSSGSVTAIGMSRIYEDEAAAIRKLMESSDEA